MDHFDDIGPSVVMASPGMMQSGLSRELFESWCTDKRNGVIIAGYCVEGTLAKVRKPKMLSFGSLAPWLMFAWFLQHIMSEPEEITTMSGQKLQLKMSVDYISFSAHTDYQQTSEFIRALKPPHVVGLKKAPDWSGNSFLRETQAFLLRSWSTGSRTRWPA